MNTNSLFPYQPGPMQGPDYVEYSTYVEVTVIQ